MVVLFLFLWCDALESVKFLCTEELTQCDAEAVAHPLDSHRAGVLALAEEYALDGSLWHTGYFVQFVACFKLVNI